MYVINAGFPFSASPGPDPAPVSGIFVFDRGVVGVGDNSPLLGWERDGVCAITGRDDRDGVDGGSLYIVYIAQSSVVYLAAWMRIKKG